jgi:hypothetical protein
MVSKLTEFVTINFEFAGEVEMLTEMQIKDKKNRALGINGQACVKEQKIQFNLNEKWKTNPSMGIVYLWVVFKGGLIEEICYVGQTSHSLQKRCNEHEIGFRGPNCHGSKSGLSKRNSIIKILKQGACVKVFARVSTVAAIFGEKVSLCASEEIAAISACRSMKQDLWNT